MDTYYIVGFIALIVATLLFVMYINVINMDLVMDDNEDRDDRDRSVEYIIADRGQRRNRKNNRHYDEKDLRIDEYEHPDPPEEQQILGKDGHGIRKQIGGGAGQQKKILGSGSADGFLDYMNDLTIKQKLKTDAMNISNLV
uniref:Uncharacterized protein n=1 Tax=viral metagenome TaxID=1070528 RepID=A0A6C0APE4_9ZZZZ